MTEQLHLTLDEEIRVCIFSLKRRFVIVHCKLCWVLPAERAVLSLQRVGAPVYLWRAAHAVAPVVALHGLGSCSS